MVYLKQCNDMTRLLFSSIHVFSGMPPRGEELRVLRWADTAAVQRNVFICQSRLLLIFSYNKVSQNSNNPFFVVGVPCPLVERCLFLYLAYTRPFGDFPSRQLKLISATVPTDPHLFTAYSTPFACFSSAACSKILQKSMPESPILLHFQVYRQIIVAISKKHLSGTVQPSDVNAPRDHDGRSRLLSFQTGHNPATHAGAYALDRAYPAKLQPDLLERYREINKAWHQFLAIENQQPIHAGVNYDLDKLSAGPTEGAPSFPLHRSPVLSNKTTARTHVHTLDDGVSQSSTSAAAENEQFRKRKRKREGSTSPIQRQINDLRADLAKLEHEHQMQRICQAASQGPLTQSSGSGQSSMPLYCKRGSQVSLSNCAEILCFLEDYGVLVCKQHHTAIVILDKHLLQHHKVPAATRRQVVECFSRLRLVEPAKTKLPEEPAQPIEQLGRPLTGLQCTDCGFVTINEDSIRMHCKKYHQLGWKGHKTVLYCSIKVQTFFRTGGIQKYFRVD
jgi:hypothetical protein